VNTKNPVLNDILSKGITRETFTEIWVNGTIKTWGQVVGKPEITYPIHVYTRSDSSGAADIWAKYLGANLKQENLKGVGVYSDPGILAAVQNDPLGISFTNFNFIFDNKTGSAIQGVKVVSFDVNENGKVDPEEDISTKAKTVQAIEKGVFPHPPARAEYFVTKGSPTGITKEFIKWVLTDGQKFVAANGYVELPKDVIDAELKKVG
jgi:phosphate transport system substrate-binding protein